MTSPSRTDRLTGALVSLLVGDALGVPYEFHSPEALPPFDEIEYTPPDDFQRAHKGTPPGTWSDDGAQALCLLASLLHKGKLDPEDLGRKLLNWYKHGYMAVDNRVFDIGITTGEALRKLRSGVKATEAGADHEQSNGNGSLMRVLPLALWHQGSDDALIRDAHLQSCATHRHVRSQVCCALYCLWARYVLENQPYNDAWTRAVETLSAAYQDEAAYLAELEFSVRPLDTYTCKGTGYVVDCLHSAYEVQREPNFEAVVKRAVLLGNDTDTTACVAGGIAGLRFGIAGIPERWREGLRERELYEPLLRGLLDAA